MILNSRTIRKLFLPIAVIFASILVGELSAKADDAVPSKSLIQSQTRSTLKTPLTASTLRVSSLEPSSTRVNPVTASVAPSSASIMSQATIVPNAAFTEAQATVPQSSTLTVSQNSPSTDAPGRAVPQNAPSNTPTNPANTTPSTTTPSTTTPSTTDTTPTLQQNTTPGTTEVAPATTPSTTTPGTTTTPSTTTPSTTTPDTTTVTPGRRTQSGSSYIGVGGNIGIGSGDTALGQGSFAVLSKIGLTRQFSVRPSVLFTDNVTILVPVTYDFNFGEGPTSGFGFTAAPFLGVGAAISTGGGGDVGLLLTGGIDVPLSRQFTATASVNASVTGQAAVGILLGVGYNFNGF